MAISTILASVAITLVAAGGNHRPCIVSIQADKPAQSSASIGTATMEADGTIVLRLIARGPGGIIGHGMLRYPPTDPKYRDILAHIGLLRPGESKSVPPWPD